MKLLLDNAGKLNYDVITGGLTVQSLLDAIDIYLLYNKLPCEECEESCCKKSWAVEADNVCINRLCDWDEEKTKNFVQDKLVFKENYFREFDQYDFKKETECDFITPANLCTIYEKRPIICRLYICSPKSHRYNMLRELIAAVYLEALVIEEKIRNGGFPREVVSMYMRNPAVFTRDYNITLDDIFCYAREEGWLDMEEMQELYHFYGFIL